jgi:hypothetical protein
MRPSATVTGLFAVLAVTAMVTFTAIAESRRRAHWCSSPRFVVTTYAAINNGTWLAQRTNQYSDEAAAPAAASAFSACRSARVRRRRLTRVYAASPTPCAKSAASTERHAGTQGARAALAVPCATRAGVALAALWDVAQPWSQIRSAASRAGRRSRASSGGPAGRARRPRVNAADRCSISTGTVLDRNQKTESDQKISCLLRVIHRS